jgi:hypothetical protein
MATYYVNSGNTLSSNGEFLHAGREVKGEFLACLKEPVNPNSPKGETKLEKFLKKGTIVKDKPKLDPMVDKKSGSALVNKVSVPEKAPKNETGNAPQAPAKPPKNETGNAPQGQ